MIHDSVRAIVSYRATHSDHELHVLLRGPSGEPLRMVMSTEPWDRGVELQPTIEPLPWGFSASTTSVIQAIVDAAYEAGIRPSSYVADTASSDRHLEDMRQLAFGALGMKKPGSEKFD